MENHKRKRSKVLDRIMKTITIEEFQEALDRIWISIKIYDAMEAKGIWKKDLAEKMGVSEEDVSDWVSGTMDIPEKTLGELEDILGIELFKNEENGREQES